MQLILFSSPFHSFIFFLRAARFWPFVETSLVFGQNRLSYVLQRDRFDSDRQTWSFDQRLPDIIF